MPSKYKILDMYIYSGKTNKDIGIELGLAEKTVENTISRLYKDFLNMRETKCLIVEQSLPVNFKSELLDTNQINKEFLERLSEPDSPTLTDNELLFCEMYNQDHDEIKAIETARLNIGFKRDSMTDNYKTAMHLRGYYLRRKPNIASYLTQLQKDRLSILEDGKVFMQSELLSVINKLKMNDSERSTSNYLKAVETLGRILGAFDDKVTVETINGDSAIDKILERAKQANVKEIEELKE